MNILVSNISTLPPEKFFNPKEYEIKVAGCDVPTISAIHTNESIVKCFAEMKEIKQAGGINRIIMMVSKKVKEPVAYCDGLSAKDYFKKIVEEIMPIPEYVEIDIEDGDGNQLPTSRILDEICSNIQRDDKVYIDSAGGQRNISNLVQLLAKILRYIGVETPCTLYADIQNKPFINNTLEFTNMTDLADALNEFMTTGKSDQLKGCFDNPSPGVETLLDAMRDFSDKIRLGNVDDLDETIVKLRKSIVSCKNVFVKDDVEMVVLKRFLPVIEQKLLGESEKMDYANIIQWCLDNCLIQQALTVFVEKIPTLIFDVGIVSFNGNREEAKAEFDKKFKTNPVKSNWEADALYTAMLNNPSVEESERQHLFDEFVNCLKHNGSPKHEQVKKAVGLVRKFNGYKKPVRWTSPNPLESELIKYYNDKNSPFRDYNGFVKNLTANLCPMSRRLLNIEEVDSDKKDTLEKKFSSVAAIMEGKKNPDFSWPVQPKEMAYVLYGYLYAKTARNRINHASSDENLDEKQQGVLSEIGYDFSRYDLDTVKANVQKALDAVRMASVVVAENKISELFEETGIPVASESKTEELGMENDAEPYMPPKIIETKIPTLQAPVVIGKIDLDSIRDERGKNKKKRK